MTRDEKNINRLFTCIFLAFSLCFIFPFPKAKLSRKCSLLYLAFCVSLLICSLNVTQAYQVLKRNHFEPKAIVNMLAILVSSFNRMLLSLKMESMKKIFRDLSTTTARNRVCVGRWKYRCLVAWFVSSVALNFLILGVEIGGGICGGAGGKSFTSQCLDEMALPETVIYAYHVSLVFFLLSPLHAFTVYYTVLCLQTKNRLKEFKILLRSRIDPADYSALYKAYSDIEGKIHSANNQLDVFVLYYVFFYGVMVYVAVTLFLHPHFYENSTERYSVVILCLNTLLCSVVMMTSAIGVGDESLEISREATRLRGSEVAVQLRFHSSVDKGIHMSVWGMGHMKRSIFLTLLGIVFTYCILVDGIWSMMMTNLKYDDETSIV